MINQISLIQDKKDIYPLNRSQFVKQLRLSQMMRLKLELFLMVLLKYIHHIYESLMD